MQYQEVLSEALPRRIRQLFFIGGLATGLLSLGYLVPTVDEVYAALALCLVLFLVLLATIGPEVATWVFAFVIFINLPGIATQVYQLPAVVACAFFFLLVPHLIKCLLIRQGGLIFDRTLKLMLLFLVVVLTSAQFAKDDALAIRWIAEFVLEGPLLYFSVINVVRNLNVLKRVLWALMVGGSLLGSLSLYQEATLSYDQEFGGLAQRSVQYWTGHDKHLEQEGLFRTRSKVGTTNRAQGPVDDPNFYAQDMLMILPLAFFVFWHERVSRTRKVAAALAVLLILGGLLLTYSRGAFLSLAMMFGILTLMGHVRIHKVLPVALVFLIICVIAAPGYRERMQTIFNVGNLFSESAITPQEQPDSAIKGRLTEMLASINTFLDHPILGVGPGQYRYYSVEYMNNPEIAFRDIDVSRSAHCLYCQLAAETGVLGIALFTAIVFLAMHGLLRARRRWIGSHPDLAALATAFLMAIIGYLGTATFLTWSYQRYFWLLLALISVTIRILSSEKPYEISEPEDTHLYAAAPVKTSKSTRTIS